MLNSSLSTTYHYRNSMVPRTYTTDHTVYYTLPTSERNFDFQKPQSTTKTISGKELKRVPQRPQSSEQKFIGQRVVKPQPNSKRTLIPELLVYTITI